MTLVRTLLAALAAVTALSGFAAAQSPAPIVPRSPYDYLFEGPTAQANNLTDGVWVCNKPVAKGRVAALAFSADGKCLMAVFDVNTKKKVGQSAGTYTLYGQNLTMTLAAGTVRGTLTFLGPDTIQIVDTDGEVLTFIRLPD
jgi:hypothetical protein